jgi:hypothetical protein
MSRLLLEERHLTSGSRELMAKLALPLNSGSVTSVKRWQLLVCLLLAALVIYNPYLSGVEAGAGLCLRHSASNRASVGASELQHFTPIDGRSVVASDAVALLQAFAGLAVPTSEPYKRTTEKVLVALVNLPASLWFRPPPAR